MDYSVTEITKKLRKERILNINEKLGEFEKATFIAVDVYEDEFSIDIHRNIEDKQIIVLIADDYVDTHHVNLALGMIANG